MEWMRRKKICKILYVKLCNDFHNIFHKYFQSNLCDAIKTNPCFELSSIWHSKRAYILMESISIYINIELPTLTWISNRGMALPLKFVKVKWLCLTLCWNNRQLSRLSQIIYNYRLINLRDKHVHARMLNAV